MANITFKGTPVHTNGELPTEGAPAPEFCLVDNDLAERSLADYRGRRKLLNIVPSLDTDVCAASARRFNQRAGDLKNTVVLVISADLPFASKRFCATEGLSEVVPLSMMRGKAFARSYGVLMEDGPLAGLCARAVVVVDQEDRVLYTQLVPEITEEPDYEAALAALA